MIEALRPYAFPATLALLMAACGEDRPGRELPAMEGRAARTGSVEEATLATASPGQAPSGRWNLASNDEGAALVFPASGTAAVRLFCPAGSRRLVVNVPSFQPVGSEERMTFGGGAAAHTLVADVRGDKLRGGVTGSGPVPRELVSLIAGRIAINYGAQASGPHPAPPGELVRDFALACRDSEAPAAAPMTKPVQGAAKAGACATQDGERLGNRSLRAVGTEPFWAAAIEGRCVTYSHPEDQQGTRVWTRYVAGAGGGGTWTGALGGRAFVLDVRPQAGCSDGMSDRRYPLAVQLTVGGEQRQGCAAPY